MAVTLAELAELSPNKVVQGFINELVTDSFILSQLQFDDCLSATGTSNLVYQYNRMIEGMEAKFRALNTEPTKTDSKEKAITVTPGILSGAFDIDRVAKAANESLYQEKLTELKNAIIRGFGNAFIKGDKTVDANGFDGLSKALSGTSTELVSAVDLSAVTKDSALAFANEMDVMLGELTRDPDVIMVSKAMKSRMNAICRILGINAVTMDTAGHRIQVWDGIRIEECKGQGVTNNDVYAMCLGMEDLHGITLKEDAISVNLPNWDAPGAVKTIDAEFVCGVALRKTKAAGVLRAKPATPAKPSEPTTGGNDSGSQPQG